MRTIVPLIAALALAAAVLPAAAQLAGRCQNLDPANDGDADRAFTCIADLENELDLFAQQMAQLGALINAAVPADAVVAFDRPNGCPEGWSPFAAAQSRAIVGATDGPFEAGLGRDSANEPLRELKYREHGGAETVTLIEAEMPQHDHQLDLVTDSTGQHSHQYLSGTRAAGGDAGLGLPQNMKKNTDAAGSHSHEITGATQHKGNNQPHDNMPPYLALYFCKKD